MATAHLIHGYLGAGKTTFARQLERDLPAIRFSHDEWMTRLYGTDPPLEHFPEFYQRVLEPINAVWPRCLELGLDVILDLGFWSRGQRNETRLYIASIGAKARLYHLSCSDDDAWERIEKRNANLNGSLFIARNTFDVLKAQFEPLGRDEEYIPVPAR